MAGYPHILVVAAGRGSRAGEGLPKQYRFVGGEPLLTRTLRAMLADPAHLDRGAASPRTEGQMATQAVERLRQGRVRPLPR